MGIGWPARSMERRRDTRAHTHTKTCMSDGKEEVKVAGQCFVVQVSVATDELSHECSHPFFCFIWPGFYLELSLLLVHRLHQLKKK